MRTLASVVAVLLLAWAALGAGQSHPRRNARPAPASSAPSGSSELLRLLVAPSPEPEAALVFLEDRFAPARRSVWLRRVGVTLADVEGATVLFGDGSSWSPVGLTLGTTWTELSLPDAPRYLDRVTLRLRHPGACCARVEVRAD